MQLRPPQPTPSPSPDVDVAAQCPELKLTQEQIDKINVLKVAAIAKLKTQKAALKEAKATLMKSFSDVNITQDVVVKQEGAIKDGVSSMLDTIFEATNHMAFDVLTKEQRQPGVACFQKIRKDMHKKWLDKKRAARGGGSEEESETEIDTF